MPIRVIAIDDHPIILKFIEGELARHPDLELVGTQTHAGQLMKLVRTTQPEVVILDLRMGQEVFEPVPAVQSLKQEFPDLQIIVLTGEHSEVLMHQLTRAGVRGYLLKSDDLSLNLPLAIRMVHSGRLYLSPAVSETLLDYSSRTRMNLENFTDQELNILRLLCQGLQNDQIADELNLSSKRISNVLTQLYIKLDVGTIGNKRLLAIEKARELNLC